MHKQNVDQEITQHKREINKQIRTGEAKASDFGEVTSSIGAPKRRVDLSANGNEPAAATPRKKMSLGGVGAISASATPKAPNMWDETPGRPQGDATPNPNATPRIWDATPAHSGATGGATPSIGTTPSSKRNRWDETPRADKPGLGAETPGSASWGTTPRVDRTGGGDGATSGRDTVRARKSRWDMTPANDTPGMMTPGGMTPGSMTPGGMTPGSMTPGGATPKLGGGATPGGSTPMMGGLTPGGSTPVGISAQAMATPAPGQARGMVNESKLTNQWATEIDERNRPLTDEELDAMLPPGYKVLDPPPGYAPIRTPSRKITATPTPMNNQGQQSGFFIQEETEMSTKMKGQELQTADAELPSLKPDDMQYFDKLLIDVDENALSPEEVKERRIMKLLLKIKNGTPPMRKSALRQITDRAREFGAGPLLNQILPLLMSPTLEDQERHLLVKVIDRILYKLDDLVRPYVHKILVVIEPLLIDEDYYARVEGREIISNLAKAAGLATMISTMRPDIDNIDEYVRNTTARAFAVVATALGIPSLLPFLKAVCRSKKSWQARHTGIKDRGNICIKAACAMNFSWSPTVGHPFAVQLTIYYHVIRLSNRLPFQWDAVFFHI